MRPLAFVLALLAAALAWAETPPPTGSAAYADAGANLFVDDELTQITVTIDPADLLAMLADPYDPTYRVCTVRIVNSRIDQTWHDVGMRPRGNTSRNAIKKSWKLKFNEFVQGGRVRGLKSLNLNGHQNDPSVVRGKLAWDLYNAFGVPSSRASMVRLVVNDGALIDDVYVSVEQIDDLFVDAWFGNDEGNLYQCAYKGARADLRFVPPGDADAYATLGSLTYELEEDSGADQHADLADFIAFIETASDAAFAAGIIDRFSVDNFLRALAVDAVVGHWDNMWYGANNYFLYKNPATGRFEYIPYDLDNTLGIDFFATDWAARPPLSFGNGGFGWDYASPFGGGAEPPLVRRILAIDAYRDQYLRYVRRLVGALGQPDRPVETVFADTAGDVFHAASDPHFDILSVAMSNDEDNLRAAVTVAGPVDVGGSTDQARIMFFFDTRTGGSLGNPWGRQIHTTTRADFFLGTWTDHGGGFIFYEWTGGDWTIRNASFNNPGGIAQDLTDKAQGVVRYTVPLAALGLGDTASFTFDVVTTNDRGQGFEPGLDHLSNPIQATPDYNTASNAGVYPAHTLTPFTPDPGETVDGPFGLPALEASIDTLRAQLAPYAFQGSFAGGASDYGFTNADFLASFDHPAAYAGGAPAPWGVKPYIASRTDHLRANTPAPPPLPALFINEVIATNSSIIADEFGEFDDFIEIHNAGDQPVDLSGMYLTDDPGRPRRWPFPQGTTINPGGFLIVWADNQPHQGPLHAGFGLSSGGETVAIFHDDANGVVLINSLTYPALGPDESFGRFPDGSDQLHVFCAVTPAGPNNNDDDCFNEPAPTPRVFINEWLASNSGIIRDEFNEADDMIELYNDEPLPVDLSGRFLTDNLSNPTKWQIPEGVVIPAGGHLVFWADNQPHQGPLHAPFALAAGGEAIGLFDRADNQFAPIDTVVFGAQTTNVSEGRSPDASPCIARFAPTPGARNPAGHADLNADGVLDLADIIAFTTAFINQSPPADLNGDTLFDLADITEFVARFTAPCPE
jgi:hypothetical protein